MRRVERAWHPTQEHEAGVTDCNVLQSNVGEARLNVIREHFRQASLARVSRLTCERHERLSAVITRGDAVDEVAAVGVGEGADVLGKLIAWVIALLERRDALEVQSG